LRAHTLHALLPGLVAEPCGVRDGLIMQVYLVEWECGSCGERHSFRHSVNQDDGWPNKFELTCENADCGQEQDVPFRACTATLLGTE